MTDPGSRSGGSGHRNDGGNLDTVEPVIDVFERLADRYGLNRSCGRIYGLCYFTAEPQSLDDLVGKSGYAKSTVSTATQTLTRLSLLSRRSGAQGGQRVYFTAESDVGSVLQDLVGRRVVRDVRDLLGAVDRVDRSRDTNGRPDDDTAPIDRLRADAERIGAVAELLAELPDERLDSLIEAAPEETAEEPERRRSPGFYPRWRQ